MLVHVETKIICKYFIKEVKHKHKGLKYNNLQIGISIWICSFNLHLYVAKRTLFPYSSLISFHLPTVEFWDKSIYV